MAIEVHNKAHNCNGSKNFKPAYPQLKSARACCCCDPCDGKQGKAAAECVVVELSQDSLRAAAGDGDSSVSEFVDDSGVDGPEGGDGDDGGDGDGDGDGGELDGDEGSEWEVRSTGAPGTGAETWVGSFTRSREQNGIGANGRFRKRVYKTCQEKAEQIISKFRSARTVCSVSVCCRW